MSDIQYKYHEDEVIQYLQKYIDSTYGQHYAGNENNIQTVDVWKALEIDRESFQSNILKYAMRYGKKDGHNLKDLMKILHYTLLLIERNHLTQIQSSIATAVRADVESAASLAQSSKPIGREVW